MKQGRKRRGRNERRRGTAVMKWMGELGEAARKRWWRGERGKGRRKESNAKDGAKAGGWVGGRGRERPLKSNETRPAATQANSAEAKSALLAQDYQDEAVKRVDVWLMRMIMVVVEADDEDKEARRL